MNAPIRVVCEGCLRSVEFAPDGSLANDNGCPFCGHRIESRTSEVGPSDAETCVPPKASGSRTTDTPETIDWATAWTRGTLGTLGRFQLRERLGDGGFGQVYLAYDPRLDRDVALKVLKLSEPNERVMERFFREARAVARLDHPNIVSVHDAGRTEGRCWVAYQLVSGRPLWWYRDRQRMDPATAARIIHDLAHALSHAHSMGVVHRDIKPGNVMIDDRGRPRLIDFGLARRSDVDSDLTRDGVIVGTPAYMSPEQAVGLSRQADERSDVYSLGVLFYELLCGRRPNELRAESDAPAAGPPRPPAPLPPARSINRAVPRKLDAICARAMSARPSDRYPSARVLAEAIDDWLVRRGSPGVRAALGVLILVCLVGTALSAVSLPRLVTGKRPVERPSVASPPLAGTPATEPKPAPPLNEAKVEVNHVVAKPPLHRTGQVVASKTSKEKIYHTTACGSVKQIEDSKKRFFDTPEEAESHNYRLCEKCRDNQAKAGGPPPSAD